LLQIEEDALNQTMPGQFLLAIIILTFFVPLACWAQMTPMSPQEMSGVTAQSGILFQAERLGLKMQAENVYYGDEDGLGGETGPGYLSLCDLDLQGAMQWTSPVTVEVGTIIDPFGGSEVTGVDLEMDGMTLDIDSLSIGAIRVGSAPGQGKSFGSFGISNMHTELSGHVRIWAH
jgi:hypothetical protein